MNTTSRRPASAIPRQVFRPSGRGLGVVFGAVNVEVVSHSEANGSSIVVQADDVSATVLTAVPDPTGERTTPGSDFPGRSGQIHPRRIHLQAVHAPPQKPMGHRIFGYRGDRYRRAGLIDASQWIGNTGFLTDDSIAPTYTAATLFHTTPHWGIGSPPNRQTVRRPDRFQPR